MALSIAISVPSVTIPVTHPVTVKQIYETVYVSARMTRPVTGERIVSELTDQQAALSSTRPLVRTHFAAQEPCAIYRDGCDSSQDLHLHRGQVDGDDPRRTGRDRAIALLNCGWATGTR